MSDYCPGCGLEIWDAEDDCLCSATATTSGAPLSERVRTAAFVDPPALRDWADEIAALEAERDRLRDALKSISEGGYYGADTIADAALKGGDG